jgi:hypothetical protein
VALAARDRDAKRRTGLDERGLERSNQRPNEQPALVQIDDRVRHELARAVVGDFSAALDPPNLDPAGGELIGAGPDMARIGVAAEGQDGRMFEQEQLVADHAGGALADQSLLPCMRILIGDPAQPASMQETIGRGAR